MKIKDNRQEQYCGATKLELVVQDAIPLVQPHWQPYEKYWTKTEERDKK